jgi:hypothetical protein
MRDFTDRNGEGNATISPVAWNRSKQIPRQPILLPPPRAGDDVGFADIRAAQRGWGGEVSPGCSLNEIG